MFGCRPAPRTFPTIALLIFVLLTWTSYEIGVRYFLVEVKNYFYLQIINRPLNNPPRLPWEARLRDPRRGPAAPDGLGTTI
jgi:hypothetical protein